MLDNVASVRGVRRRCTLDDAGVDDEDGGRTLRSRKNPARTKQVGKGVSKSRDDELFDSSSLAPPTLLRSRQNIYQTFWLHKRDLYERRDGSSYLHKRVDWIICTETSDGEILIACNSQINCMYVLGELVHEGTCFHVLQVVNAGSYRSTAATCSNESHILFL